MPIFRVTVMSDSIVTKKDRINPKTVCTGQRGSFLLQYLQKIAEYCSALSFPTKARLPLFRQGVMTIPVASKLGIVLSPA